MRTRRRLFAIAGVGVLQLFWYSSAEARSPQPSPALQQPVAPPPESILQTGDLIWPKKPDAVVPFNSTPGAAGEKDEAQWRAEKAEYLATIRSDPKPSPEDAARYALLQPMEYSEFVARYLGDTNPDEPVPFGGAATHFYVGHVGIIQVRDGVASIIEARMGMGVRRISYRDWLKERPGELVWIGRVSNLTSQQSTAIAEFAERQIGKPYRFFNFDLADASGFYCSKLAWLSVREATGVVLDDNPSSKRSFWYSPKRLMRSPHVVLLVNPGSYTRATPGAAQ